MSVKSPAGYGSVRVSTGTAPERPTSSDSFVTRARRVMDTRRAWREFLDPTSFFLPDSYAEAMSRIRHNLSRFRANYAMVVLCIVFLSLLWRPVSMIMFIIVDLAWIFLYFSRDREEVVVFGRAVDDRLVLGFLSLITVIALALTHVGLNVLVSLIIGFVITGFHAAFRVSDDMFLDEESAREGGLLSVKGPTHSTSYASPFQKIPQ